MPNLTLDQKIRRLQIAMGHNAKKLAGLSKDFGSAYDGKIGKISKEDDGVALPLPIKKTKAEIIYAKKWQEKWVAWQQAMYEGNTPSPLPDPPPERKAAWENWNAEWKKNGKKLPPPPPPYYPENPYADKTYSQAAAILSQFFESNYDELNKIKTEEDFQKFLKTIQHEFNEIYRALPTLIDRNIKNAKETNEWFESKLKMYMLNIENYSHYNHLVDLIKLTREGHNISDIPDELKEVGKSTKYEDDDTNTSEVGKKIDELIGFTPEMRSKAEARALLSKKDGLQLSELEVSYPVDSHTLANLKAKGLAIVYIDTNERINVNKYGHVAIALLDENDNPIAYSHVNALNDRPKFFTPDQFKVYMHANNRNMMGIQKIYGPNHEELTPLNMYNAVTYLRDHAQKKFRWNPVTNNCTDYDERIILAAGGKVVYDEHYRFEWLPYKQLAHVDIRDY